MTARAPVPLVFLLDVDNTLLDNDRIAADLREHLERAFGTQREERYWELFEQLRDELGYDYREVDVDGEQALTAEYSDRVPVVLIDGREHGYWRVEEPRFRKALARPVRPRP